MTEDELDPETWGPPRCSHGRIILACPDDDCVEQNAYLDEHHERVDAFVARQQADARRLVRGFLGLPDEDEPEDLSMYACVKPAVDPCQIYQVRIGVGFLGRLSRESQRLGYTSPSDWIRDLVEASLPGDEPESEGDWISEAMSSVARAVEEMGPAMADAARRSGTRTVLEQRARFDAEKEGRG